ncbi:tetratricopeptide repeat protein [Dactylosporangium matsuzakiense]|uniref:tetratricopeptide repeat protein n=1 Tax=Dactylosporangium matsuzakiense TaxID=53360 RepID=UPI0022F2DE63|nr:tetratricopeptide repeat protein [Dactylosporangium matsuzakiense]
MRSVRRLRQLAAADRLHRHQGLNVHTNGCFVPEHRSLDSARQGAHLWALPSGATAGAVVARPERQLFPRLDPLHAFAQRLRDLRETAGNPPYKAMAHRTGRSRTALSDAAGGDHLPSWETVVAYVSHCGGEPNQFRLDWERIRDLREGPAEGPDADIGELTNLPRRPAGLFVGRTATLAALDPAPETDPATVGVVVHGLGGVGKTEAVLQYAQARRSRYTPLWWATADTEDNLAQSLAAFTRTVHRTWPTSAGVTDAAAWALRWFASHDGWLLVLDNVVDPAVIAEVLAAAARGRVIATSRRELDWRAIGLAPLRLDVLDRPLSLNLLLDRTGRRGERAELAQLAADVGDLPLALTHAASYLVERRHVSVAEYRLRLAEQPARLLGAPTQAHPTDDSVARTWQMSITALAEADTLAIDLLDIIAYLAPDTIPVRLLAHLGPDALAVDDALTAAVSYSLITRDESTLHMHRLVQTVIRAGHHHAGPCSAAVAILLAAMPPGNPEADVSAWPAWSQIAPHIEAVAARLRSPTAPADDPELTAKAGRLLGVCGLYQRGQGRYETALALMRQGAECLERVLGREHVDVIAAQYLLAGGLWSAGRFAEALELGSSTWHARRRLLGPEHPDTLANASYVALGYRELGRLDDALELTTSTLDARLRTAGPDDPGTLQSRNNLAGCLRALGRHEQALALYESNLADRIRVLGPQHPDTLQSRHNLAGGLLAVGRESEAIEQYLDTLSSRRLVLGAEHPDTLHTQHLLASAYSTLGRTDDAIALFEATLRSRRQLLGPSHPDTGKTEQAFNSLRRSGPSG